MKQHKKRGLLASVGAFVAASALLIGGSVAANAAPQPVPENADVTITKLSQPAAPGAPATGIKNDSLPVDAEAIDGVIFDYYLVTGTGVGEANDIGTNAGQIYAAGLTAATANAPTLSGSFDATGSGANADGVTTKNLPRGLYVVKERAASVPAGVVRAVDFLLAVPMTHPTDLDTWLDTIYVYPKNMRVQAEKSVNEGTVLETGEENTFDWAIVSDVPRVMNAEGNTIKADSVVITDTLDSRLTLDATNGVVVEIVDAAGIPITGDDQLVAADYAVTGNVEIAFADTGLTKLHTAAGTAGHQIKTTIKTYVNDATLDDTTGTAIVNSATISINAGKENALVVETNDAQTNWGLVSFTKTDNAGTPAALAGATFALRATADGDALLTAQTSAANGKVTFNGVRTSDRVNGVLLTDIADYQVYYIVETKAPSGFQLLAEPLPVVLMTDGTIKSVTLDAEGKVTALGDELTDIVNVANAGGFVLPLTGGMGTALLTVIGLGIIGFVVIVARRRRNAEAAH